MIAASSQKRFRLATLGCKVNQYESDAMAQQLIDNGYSLCTGDEIADICIVNTCAVTETSERKSIQAIRRAKRENPDSTIVVVGCLSQIAEKKVKGIPGVSLIIGTDGKSRLFEEIVRFNKEGASNLMRQTLPISSEYEKLRVTSSLNRIRAYVKIEDGCSQYCSYCVIPYARGNVRSRSIPDIISEMHGFVENGYKEIILTGINLSSYGADTASTSLLDVITEASKIIGLERIRLSSLEPLLLTPQFIDVLSDFEKVCNHFHIALQSGCDTVLERMHRNYATTKYLDIVQRIRRKFPNAAITTDIITGFPGETDDEFYQTKNFMKLVKFADAHIFSYSPKAGTQAAEYCNQVPQITKRRRSKELIDLVNSLRMEFFEQQYKTDQQVLIEKQLRENLYLGKSTNYIPVQVSSPNDITNQIVQVRISDVSGDKLIGILAK